MPSLWPGCLRFWSGDDLNPVGREGVDRYGVTDMRRGMNGLSLQVQERSDAIRMPVTFTSFADVAGIVCT